MDTEHWFLFEWRVVGRSTTPISVGLLTSIAEVFEKDGLTPDTEREASRQVAALYKGLLYRDANDTTSVQIHVVWEDEEHWALHALQFLRPQWYGYARDSSMTTVLQSFPEQVPVPTALPMIRRLSTGAYIPRVWSTIVDAPSAAVEAWLRDRVFAHLGTGGYDVRLYDFVGEVVETGLPHTVVIGDNDYWIWNVLAPPRWVSLPSGNWWVIPTNAAITRPEVAPITHIPPQTHASIALRIAEYNGRTTLDAHTFFFAHPLLDWLVRDFREGDARILFPPRAEHDHRTDESLWLTMFMRSPREEVAEHLRTLSGAKRMVAELFLKGLTLKDVIRQLEGTVTESTIRRYFWEFHRDPKYAWLTPYLPPPNPKLSEAGRRAWER